MVSTIQVLMTYKLLGLKLFLILTQRADSQYTRNNPEDIFSSNSISSAYIDYRLLGKNHSNSWVYDFTQEYLLNDSDSPETKNCLAITDRLEFSDSSILILMNQNSDKFLKIFNCLENSSNLKKIVYISSNLIENISMKSLSNHENLRKKSEIKIIEIKFCSSGFFNIESNECEKIKFRRKLTTYDELVEIYKNNKDIYQVTGTIQLMMADEQNPWTKAFFDFLVDELYSYSQEITTADEYEVVHYLIINMMNYSSTEFKYSSANRSTLEKLYNCSNVALSVEDPGNLKSLGIKFSDIVVSYLRFYQSLFKQRCKLSSDSKYFSDIYPSLISKVIEDMNSYYIFVFTGDCSLVEEFEQTSKDFEFELKVELKLNKLYGSDLDCDCSFCTYPFMGINITTVISGFGFKNDIFSIKIYKTGEERNEKGVDDEYYSEVSAESNSKESCFSFSQNLNLSSSTSSPIHFLNISRSSFQKGLNPSFNSESKTLTFTVSFFGIYYPIQACPGNTNDDGFLSCSTCTVDCSCECFKDCQSCLSGYDGIISSICSSCTSSQTCKMCQDGFYQDELGRCLKCTSNCTCSKEGECLTCLNNKNYDTSKNCTDCLKGYDSGRQCSLCSLGYKNVSDVCTVCPSSCCDVGQYYNNVSRTCDKCIENCSCDRANSCQGCIRRI